MGGRLFDFIQFINENWVSMALRIFVTREKGAETSQNLATTLKMDFLGWVFQSSDKAGSAGGLYVAAKG